MNVYQGSVLIEFSINKLEDIFVDFAGTVKKLVVNGKDVENINHLNDRIFLDKTMLIPEKNQILIVFENHFSSSSHGIRIWCDPKDIVNIKNNVRMNISTLIWNLVMRILYFLVLISQI